MTTTTVVRSESERAFMARNHHDRPMPSQLREQQVREFCDRLWPTWRAVKYGMDDLRTDVPAEQRRSAEFQRELARPDLLVYPSWRSPDRRGGFLVEVKSTAWDDGMPRHPGVWLSWSALQRLLAARADGMACGDGERTSVLAALATQNLADPHVFLATVPFIAENAREHKLNGRSGYLLRWTQLCQPRWLRLWETTDEHGNVLPASRSLLDRFAPPAWCIQAAREQAKAAAFVQHVEGIGYEPINPSPEAAREWRWGHVHEG